MLEHINVSPAVNPGGSVAPLKLDNSMKLLAEGSQCIAGFTQSMMKKPEQFALGEFPVYLAGGRGAEVTDVDGNTYIDYVCGLGANMLGHNHPLINAAITENLSKGILHSLPAPVEITTAKQLIEIIPGAEKVRFFKTGADANSAAIRLARFVTGKEKIITVGYNGWHDQYMYDTPGVPKAIQEYTQRMPLFTANDEEPLIEAIKNQADLLAAVLLSVPYTRQLSAEFVHQLQVVCRQHHVLFIIDEVVTGFRLALGGAQEYFGVQADLVTLSKGMAGGMPLSAVVGSHALMDAMEKLQVSTTFGGEMLSLEVCGAVLGFYRDTPCIEHIAQLGARLKQETNKISARLNTPLTVEGYDAIPMFLFHPNPEIHVRYAKPFVAALAKRGVLMRRDVNFISAAHTREQIDYTVSAIEGALAEMKTSGLFENTK